MAAGIVVGLLGPIINVAKCIAAPIKRQFSYLCCFNSNVQILEKEANDLENARHDLQRKVDTHTRNAQVIGDQVNTWLNDVEVIQRKKSELDEDIANASKRGCWSVKYRYSASRGAVKTAEDMKQKVAEGSKIPFIAIGPQPTSPAAHILERPACDFESRAKIEEALTTMLKDESVAVVGICGMGGVGKTTIAEKIMNKLKKENIFGESVMATVSQSLNKEKIQGEIAEKLGLELKETSLSSRAEKLCIRLMGGKRVLLVLDDVWEHLNLSEIGIPCISGPEGCTVLITSRNKNVLTRMDIAEPNILKVEVLTKEEAWSLFKEKLGICSDDQLQFFDLAREITSECRGLPLALASVAGALKVEKKIHGWKSALQYLRRCNPEEDLLGVLTEVYTPLKLSYDYLRTQSAKTIFLLCSLFPEDGNIDLQDLIVIAMGLRIFEGIENLEQLRDTIKTHVDMLKDRSLLLEGRNESYVKMHDIVRDVAIFIASKVPEERPLIKRGFESTWISPFVGGEKIKFSMESTFPNLRLLMLPDLKNKELHIKDLSFEGMKELNVLFIRCSLWHASIFSSTSLLLSENLRTLVLVNCRSLEAISAVGDLWNLEILICRECDAIKEFPSETLKSLKLLEISNCQSLEKVGSAVVLPCSDERNFEQIKITFPKLESLVLSCLGNLRVFYQGNDSIEFPLLSHVQIERCPQLKGLISSSRGSHRNNDDHDHSLHLFCKQKVSFGNLMKLELKGLTNCDNVFCPQIPVGSFNLLEEFKIENHQSIKSLFSFSIARSLKRLKILKISNCEEMVKVIEEEDGECSNEIQHITVEFPKLESLILKRLPNLRVFYQGNASIKFPLLGNLKIIDCSQLKGLVSSSEGIRMSNGDDDHSLHLICNQKVSFGNLMKLELEGLTNCDNVFCPQIPVDSFNLLEEFKIENHQSIKSLFSFSIARSLKRLKILKISNCEEMVKVIEEEEGECSNEIQHITVEFPKLESLVLKRLPNLRVFYQGNASIKFPRLGNLKIIDCSQLKGVVSSSEGIRMSNGDDDHSLHLICNQKVSFGNLMKRLELSEVGLTNCDNVFCSQIPVGSFSLLEEFKIKDLQSIKILFSFSIAQNLKSLKLLMISDCKEMVKVIEEEKGEHSHEIQHITIEFPKLESLVLKKLPNLRVFYPGIASIKFPLLHNLEIDRCNQLKSLGSSSEGICTSGSDDDHSLHLLCNHKVSFGSFMRRLKLNGRTNYDYIFCPQIPMGSFTHLEKLDVWSCANNKILFPFSIAQNLDSLKVLRIDACNEMEKVIEEAEEGCSHDTTLVFPHLEQLTLRDLPRLKTFCNSALGFPKLVKLEIQRCMGGFNLGSLTTPNLESLESLEIWDCERNMEHVFWWSEVENKNSGICHSRHVKFPNLRTLKLIKLSRLTSIFKGVESIEFPHLTRLDIDNCPNLKSAVSATTCSNSGDINNEAVGKLKEQTSSIWDQISIGSSFTTLEYLSIDGFDVISSLFSSSIARNLINLKELHISSCKEMVKVIEGEVEEYSHETTLLFPLLEQLWLFKLPQLKSFCEWKCALELPSLEDVYIYDCPKIERFSLGSLKTPKLESIGIDDEHITIAGELNDVVQQRFLRLQEEPTSSEDETEEEDEASSDESEGDQKENDETDEEKVELAFNEEDQKEDEIEKEDEAGLGEGEGDQKKKDEIEEESKRKPTLSVGEGDKKENDEIKEESPGLSDGERDQKEKEEKKEEEST